MEISIVIKLQDGNTRVIELVNAVMQTSWNYGQLMQNVDPSQEQKSQIVGNLTLQGIIKDADLVGVT